MISKGNKNCLFSNPSARRSLVFYDQPFVDLHRQRNDNSFFGKILKACKAFWKSFREKDEVVADSIVIWSKRETHEQKAKNLKPEELSENPQKKIKTSNENFFPKILRSKSSKPKTEKPKETFNSKEEECKLTIDNNFWRSSCIDCELGQHSNSLKIDFNFEKLLNENSLLKEKSMEKIIHLKKNFVPTVSENETLDENDHKKLLRQKLSLIKKSEYENANNIKVKARKETPILKKEEFEKPIKNLARKFPLQKETETQTQTEIAFERNKSEEIAKPRSSEFENAEDPDVKEQMPPEIKKSIFETNKEIEIPTLFKVEPISFLESNDKPLSKFNESLNPQIPINSSIEIEIELETKEPEKPKLESVNFSLKNNEDDVKLESSHNEEVQKAINPLFETPKKSESSNPFLKNCLSPSINLMEIVQKDKNSPGLFEKFSQNTLSHTNSFNDMFFVPKNQNQLFSTQNPSFPNQSFNLKPENPTFQIQPTDSFFRNQFPTPINQPLSSNLNFNPVASFPQNPFISQNSLMNSNDFQNSGFNDHKRTNSHNHMFGAKKKKERLC